MKGGREAREPATIQGSSAACGEAAANEPEVRVGLLRTTVHNRAQRMCSFVQRVHADSVLAAAAC